MAERIVRHYYRRGRFSYGTAAEWTDENVVLYLGEPGFETDTYSLKIGDGYTAWNDLDYFSTGGSSSSTTLAVPSGAFLVGPDADDRDAGMGMLGSGSSAHHPHDHSSPLDTPAGQLVLPTQGSGGGLVIGTDVTLYRSFTTELSTNASLFLTAGSLYVAGVAYTGYGTASQIFHGDIGGGRAGFYLGSGLDTNLYRSAADTLKTDDVIVARNSTFADYGGFGYHPTFVADESGFRTGLLVTGASDITWGIVSMPGTATWSIGRVQAGDGDFRVADDLSATRLWVKLGEDKIMFGALKDTVLYRSAADTLKTDDKFHIAGGAVPSMKIIGPDPNANVGFSLGDSTGAWEIRFQTNPGSGWFEVTDNVGGIKHRWWDSDYLLKSGASIGWTNDAYVADGVAARVMRLSNSGDNELQLLTTSGQAVLAAIAANDTYARLKVKTTHATTPTEFYLQADGGASGWVGLYDAINARWGLRLTKADNKLWLGETQDTNLYRSAADTLQTDDSLNIRLGTGNERVVVGGLTEDASYVGFGFRTTAGALAVANYRLIMNSTDDFFNVPSGGKVYFREGNDGAAGLNIDPSANQLVFGGDSGDVNLYRSAANTLKTDDTFIAGTNLQTAGVFFADSWQSYSGAVQNIKMAVDVGDLFYFRDSANAVKLTLQAGDKLAFGAAQDTNLYRSAADSLATDDTLYQHTNHKVLDEVEHAGRSHPTFLEPTPDDEAPLIVPGSPGPQGPAGSPGVGVQGQNGPPGPPGEDGDDGPVGPPGPRGNDGAPGTSIVGPQGAQGIIGNDGDDAEHGLLLPGPRGADGAPGSAGLQGAQGIMGYDGDDAEHGLLLPGARGADGAPGSAGANGAAGVGLPGFDGEDADWFPLPGRPGAPGGLDTTMFFADKPPTTPNGIDDEFTTTGTPSVNWTDFDHGAAMTATVDEYGLRMVSNGAIDNIGGLLKAIPAAGTDFSWVIKVDATLERGNIAAPTGRLGFLLTQGTANTSDIYFLQVYQDTAAANSEWRVIVIKHGAYNTAGTTLALVTFSNPLPTMLYMRLRRVGTAGNHAWSFDISNDGLGWIGVWREDESTMPFTPAYAGPGVNGIGIMRTRFFRQLASSAYDAPLLGGFGLGGIGPTGPQGPRGGIGDTGEDGDWFPIPGVQGPTGATGTSWTQDIDEPGASFANFTAASGTWSSAASVIKQTDTAATFRYAKYNTKQPVGAPYIFEGEIQIKSAGVNHIGGLLLGFDGTGGAGLLLRLDEGNNEALIEAAATASIQSFALTVAVDTWYKIRLVGDEGAVSVYADGVLLGTARGGSASTSLGKDASYVGLMSYQSEVWFRNIKGWHLTMPA